MYDVQSSVSFWGFKVTFFTVYVCALVYVTLIVLSQYLNRVRMNEFCLNSLNTVIITLDFLETCPTDVCSD